jgi:hypothetical protein
MNWFKRLEYAIKHRGQVVTQRDEGETVSSEKYKFFFERSYDNIEVVRRGVDLIIDSATDVDINITELLFLTLDRMVVKMLMSLDVSCTWIWF